MIQHAGFVILHLLIIFFVVEKHYMVSTKLQELDTVVLVPHLLNSVYNILMLRTMVFFIIPRDILPLFLFM